MTDDPNINHIPLVGSVETDDEVLLEQLAQMPPEVIERYRRIEQTVRRVEEEGGTVLPSLREVFGAGVHRDKLDLGGP